MDGVTFRTFDGFTLTRRHDGSITGEGEYAKRLAAAIQKFEQSHWVYRK